MATIVVYDGVEDANGVEGSLFQFTKFWVAQRVPLRQEYLKKITVYLTLDLHRIS